MTGSTERFDRPDPARKLRVLVLASWYPADGSPIEGVFVRDQATILSESMEIAVIAPVQVTWRSFRSRLTRRHSKKPAPDDLVPTYRPRVIVMPRAVRLNRLLYGRAASSCFRQLLRTWGRPDLINAHVVMPAGQAAVGIGRREGIPVVLTEHSGPLAMHFWSPASRVAAIETLRSVSKVVVVGPRLREEIQSVAGVDAEVVGNVIADDFFASELPSPRLSPDLRLLAIGLLTPAKRFDILLRAMRDVLQHMDGSELVIVGDGPGHKSLAELAVTLGIERNVRIVGSATREQVRDWLAWADAIVSSSDHESFGLAVAEAMASGLPVVTTASGGPETFVEPGLGIVVPAGDARALAGALMALPELLTEFEPEVARDRMAARFGPRVFASRMTAVFKDVVANYGSTRHP